MLRAEKFIVQLLGLISSFIKCLFQVAAQEDVTGACPIHLGSSVEFHFQVSLKCRQVHAGALQ